MRTLDEPCLWVTETLARHSEWVPYASTSCDSPMYVEIKDYSVAYFDCIVTFKVPYHWASVKGRASLIPRRTMQARAEPTYALYMYEYLIYLWSACVSFTLTFSDIWCFKRAMQWERLTELTQKCHTCSHIEPTGSLGKWKVSNITNPIVAVFSKAFFRKCSGA